MHDIESPQIPQKQDECNNIYVITKPSHVPPPLSPQRLCGKY